MIDQSLDNTDVFFYTTEHQYSNTQEVGADFNRDDDPIQASIADLPGYFDDFFLNRAVNERTTRSKISMAAGC